MASDIRLVLADNLTTALEHDPAALVLAYEKRIDYLNQLGAKIQKEAESAHLISHFGKSVKTGEMDGMTGFIKSSQVPVPEWTLTQHLKNWIKDLAAVHGLKNTKYWKMFIATDALDAVKSGKMLPGMNSNSEMRAMILYAYVKNLRVERDYFLKSHALINLFMETGELTHQQMLRQHFRVFNDMDWAYHEGMLNWVIKKADKPWAARLNLSWGSAPMAEVKTAFKNYHIIRGELDQVRQQVLSQFSADYFSREGAAAAADIQVDADGFTVMGPEALPPGPTHLTEIFIDVPEGVHP